MIMEEGFRETYNPCDECDYSYGKNNQEMGMCKICEFKKLLEEPEIVHCKDCIYWIGTRIGEEELKQCVLAGYLIGERGYCLYGKKAG